MPTRRQSSAERAVELGFVVHLGNGVHAPIFRRRGEIASDGIVNLGEDDQNAIRAPGPRLGNLVGVEHEVLAQRRQRGRRARRRKVLGRALERGSVR